MAEAEYFNIGMIVSCTTCHGHKIQGEVMAFDHVTKVLALKSSSGKPNMHDVRFVNLSYVSDINVVKEAVDQPHQLTNLNTQKLMTRMKQNIEEKERQANYIGVGVTPQAQSLFHGITKTINEVRWDGQNIVVLDQVTIFPPYGIDNCKGKEGSKALQHVKKIVEKYHRDSERETRESSTSS